MIALLQRVAEARVEINQQIVGQIKQGLLGLVGFEPHDDQSQVLKQLERIIDQLLKSTR